MLDVHSADAFLRILILVFHMPCFIKTDFSPSQVNQASTCNKRIISSLSKNGTISSPHFPHPYPADITCRYTFEGVDSKERIQLKFVHMDLKYPGSNPQMAKECDGIDSVTITVVINGHNKNLGTYCGSKLPPMLMSNTAKMYVTFRSIRGTRSITGFEATYQFLTNFGISTGEQDSREVCMFNYHSAKKRSGNFTSPNYPGLYPRNTECHYLFFAKKDEYVQIKFTKFDVDGIRPGCGKKTESDYVAFSNFKEIEDRSIDRFCGNNIAPSEVESDGTFFRVIFKSNHLYDSSGFFAHYEFISTVKTDQYKTIINTDGKPETNIKKNVNPGKSTNRSSSQHRHSTFTIYSILMSILLKL